ncbi:MAG: AAA family ATPase [Ruminococcus callidus]
MTAALLSALCSRGLGAGLEVWSRLYYPMFHSHITGRPAYHADPFLSEQPMAELVSRVSADADCAVFEGNGFYDGIGQTDQASAYTVSQWLKIPVLLVVNPKGMGCSATALCHGFQTFRTPNSICGILLNDIRSGMYNYYRELLERETGLPVLGYLPHLPEVQLESRHLGLMTAGERWNSWTKRYACWEKPPQRPWNFPVSGTGENSAAAAGCAAVYDETKAVSAWRGTG